MSGERYDNILGISFPPPPPSPLSFSWSGCSKLGLDNPGLMRNFNSTILRVDVSRLHDTVAKSRTGEKSRPGATSGVNSRRGDSRRHDILWWYHVNKCRAMRGNRSELAPA